MARFHSSCVHGVGVICSFIKLEELPCGHEKKNGLFKVIQRFKYEKHNRIHRLRLSLWKYEANTIISVLKT